MINIGNSVVTVMSADLKELRCVWWLAFNMKIPRSDNAIKYSYIYIYMNYDGNRWPCDIISRWYRIMKIHTGEQVNQRFLGCEYHVFWIHRMLNTINHWSIKLMVTFLIQPSSLDFRYRYRIQRQIHYEPMHARVTMRNMQNSGCVCVKIKYCNDLYILPCQRLLRQP